jgi:hypothetical protein
MITEIMCDSIICTAKQTNEALSFLPATQRGLYKVGCLIHALQYYEQLLVLQIVAFQEDQLVTDCVPLSQFTRFATLAPTLELQPAELPQPICTGSNGTEHQTYSTYIPRPLNIPTCRFILEGRIVVA